MSDVQLSLLGSELLLKLKFEDVSSQEIKKDLENRVEFLISRKNFPSNYTISNLIKDSGINIILTTLSD